MANTKNVLGEIGSPGGNTNYKSCIGDLTLSSSLSFQRGDTLSPAAASSVPGSNEKLIDQDAFRSMLMSPSRLEKPLPAVTFKKENANGPFTAITAGSTKASCSLTAARKPYVLPSDEELLAGFGLSEEDKHNLNLAKEDYEAEKERTLSKMKSSLHTIEGRQEQMQKLQIETAEAQQDHHQESIALQLLAKEDSNANHEETMAALTEIILRLGESSDSKANEKEILRFKSLLAQTRKENIGYKQRLKVLEEAVDRYQQAEKTQAQRRTFRSTDTNRNSRAPSIQPREAPKTKHVDRHRPQTQVKAEVVRQQNRHVRGEVCVQKK